MNVPQLPYESKPLNLNNTPIIDYRDTNNFPSSMIEINIPAEENGYPEIRAKFREPTIEELGIIMSTTQDDPLKGALTFMRTVMTEGPDWIFEDVAILVSLQEELKDLIQGFPIQTETTFNSESKRLEHKVTILVNAEGKENPTFKIRQPNITAAAKLTEYQDVNPIIAARELCLACWIEGDKSIFDNQSMTLSVASAIHKIIRFKVENIKKKNSN